MKMKLYEDGEKSKAVCHHCKQLVSTTFARRDVPFSDGKGEVKNILAAVCDACGNVVAVPAQSTPAVREARRKEVRPIEAQLPAIYLDVLDLAAYIVDSTSSTEFRKVLMILYLHRFASGEFPRALLIKAHRATSERFKERRGEARRRLSMKVTPRIVEDLKTLMHDTTLSQTEVIKSVIYQIHADVIESRKPELMRELGALSVVYA
ncbi:hypothetical protein [Paraburkholderia sp. BL25I1N1]|uniref:hypothetical protein n=1 Tax=Paraburkholderia sp. BL25I1N1 TaxID=1938804 RepID=UPI000D05CA94|nr:hypothetical protein [Paraburkholderia sp. BL25I1N1]PRX98306.1 hypothetical protein B0G73_1252 [Paraburkholderia sp. BL25I1N1]